MGNLGIRITCKRCGTRVPISDMKYNVDGRSLICAACYAKQHGRGVPKEEKKLKTDAKIEPKKKAFLTYVCVRCHYKFKIAKETEFAVKCPYCGKDDRLELEQAPDANALIKESEGFD